MVRTNPVPLTRSPAEISVLNSLQRLSDLLLNSHSSGRNTVATSSVTTLRSLCRRQSSTEIRPFAARGPLERWLTLVDLCAKLEHDVQSLRHEIHVHERKRNALLNEQQDGTNLTQLPPAEACELGPKLQCLQEVLGTVRFRAYSHDLFLLVRNLRLHLELYGVRLHELEQKLCTQHFVSIEKLLELLNETAHSVEESKDSLPQEQITTPQEEAPRIEYADYVLLFQHCSEPGSPASAIVVRDLLALLHSIPLERATLVRYVFEQLADTRRGEGYRPPPDYTNIHRIYAAMKLQRRHCSIEEKEAAEAWLGVFRSEVVTLQNFVQFHATVSDANVSEDAEFVSFVQRMWGFDPLAVKDTNRGEAIEYLLENYTARCHLIELIARKRDLLVKIPTAQARIRAATRLLESELQQTRALHAPAGFSRWLQGTKSIHSRLGETFELLCELTLSGQGLTSVPDFIASLGKLQILNLHENRLATIAVTIGKLTTLQKLDLSDNLVCDASFAESDEMWSHLENLTELRLSGNKLTSLPRALVAIPNLETLDLSRNCVRLIHGDVMHKWKARSHLETLDLHANALTTLPEEIQVLSKTLRRLLLHENHLTSLPSTIVELVRLKELSLSQNQLSNDRLRCYPLPEMHTTISLAHNQLKMLPRLVVVHAEGKESSQSSHNTLISIDARNNRLRSLQDWSPLVLATCQALHLQNNALCELPQGFFTALPSLQICELQNNRLRLLPVGITQCTRLQTLHVHDNCLQSLPKEMAQLPLLEVLNATKNKLTDVPLEWHAFETQNGSARMLHSLMLRRNPLRDRTLMAIVNGTTSNNVPSSSTVRSCADDVACESVLKKLLDGLRDANMTLRDSTAAQSSTRKAWLSNDEDEESLDNRSKPKWRGIAREVNNYLEQRLRAMQHSSDTSEGSTLMVDVKSFERLLGMLPFTCSKRELAHVVRRFVVSEDNAVDERAKGSRQVDGLAFLEAIERFGRWRTISLPSKRAMNSTLKPAVDTAGPIIQYLVVLQRQEQERQYRGNGQVRRLPSPPRVKMKLDTKLKERLRTFVHGNSDNDKKTAKQTPVSRVDQVSQPGKKASKDQYDVVMDRQRQRIQVLEQQLIDQKLLLLAHEQPYLQDNDAIIPANLETVAEEDDAVVKTVPIGIKYRLTGSRESEQWSMIHVHLQANDSVLRLKQQLQVLISIPVDHQILVVDSRNRGAPGIRLRNSATLQEYFPLVGHVSKWTMTLFVGQSLPRKG